MIQALSFDCAKVTFHQGIVLTITLQSIKVYIPKLVTNVRI
jgi:hypothetical protein